MRVLRRQTSLWPQESAEVHPATSLISEVGALGDSTSQLRGSRERWSPWPEVTGQGRGPSWATPPPQALPEDGGRQGINGPAERPLLPLVSESSGTASRESRAFEVSWIPRGLWRQEWTHCASCRPLVCKSHLQPAQRCFLTLICVSTGSDAVTSGRSSGTCSSQWDTCPSQIQAAGDLGPRILVEYVCSGVSS